ncbi:adenosine deaminase [Streptomyces sp. 150FB]|uniref:adenosine deaminase family protein n=1 Tax=Streptomyces sp. 150FB TaxID=1576605 RepID=UPI00099E0460|nr:adenosine deaminase [Streptomyces sp. 150FB]
MTSTNRIAPRRRRLVPLVLGVGCLAALSLLPPSALAAESDGLPGSGRSAAPVDTEQRVADYLHSVRDQPNALLGFFQKLPKGGDLHNHLFGAASTELLVKLAGEDGLCVDEKTMKALPAPCGPGTRPAADARTDAAFRQRILRAWSMRDFPRGQSGHDHFFATFGKFDKVAGAHRGTLLAEVADTAVRQNQFYLETMFSPASPGSDKLAAEVGFHSDLARTHRLLVAGGKLDTLVRQARRETDAVEAQFRKAAACGTGRARPGCRLPFRFISGASRGGAPERVFTQLALGMRLAESDPRFVAVNLVQPEDGTVALRDYRLQMRMLAYLHGVYPRAHITLHAGELAPGLVKPEDLTFHVNDAVRTAHAERIGHGVDVAHENNAPDLLRTMARTGVAVEVSLTSNRQILGVSGPEQPFPLYREYGVPVVLATDDPGISQTDIGAEYRYAWETYGLGYRDLKELARASLRYAFLPGDSLWGPPGGASRGARRTYELTGPCRGERPGLRAPGKSCARFLARSSKAGVEWRQEQAFQRFERRIAGQRS